MYGRKATLLRESESVMRDVVNQFLSEKPNKRVWGNFRIEGDELVYECNTTTEFRAYGEGAETRWKNALKHLQSGQYKLAKGEHYKIADLMKATEPKRFKYTELKREVIAFKVKRGDKMLAVGNSSVLASIGRTVAYGHVNDNKKQTIIQRILETKIPMIPFTVFEQAKLDVKKIVFLEQGNPESVQRKRVVKGDYPDYKERTIVENIHFTGSSLFVVDGKVFLFDLDRRELKHQVFNPFLSEIPRKVATIADAYDALKPKVVKDAEAQGMEVKRQGEWFFIPAPAPLVPRLTEQEQLVVIMDNEYGIPAWLQESIGKDKLKALRNKRDILIERMPKPVTLRAGQNRPNTAECGLTVGTKTYVKGRVKHSGREHADLILKDWYIAIPNTAVKSFTITGEID